MDLQRKVYRLGRNLARLPTERLYILSLTEQQFHALDIANGYLDLSSAELATIATRIDDALNGGVD